MKKLKTILQTRYLFKILGVISIIYSIYYSFCFPIKSKYSCDTKEIIGQVIDYQIDGSKLKLTIKEKEKIIVYYYFKSETEKNNYEQKLELGITLKIVGKLAIPKNSKTPNGFNYRNYLKYHHINYYMNVSSLKIIKNNTSVF